nr:MAG TPA: hypothetical protein [Caudoviricetes sp.]
MSNKLYCKKGFFRFRKDNGKEFIVDKRKMEAICIDPNYLSYFARSIIDSLPMEELEEIVSLKSYKEFMQRNKVYGFFDDFIVVGFNFINLGTICEGDIVVQNRTLQKEYNVPIKWAFVSMNLDVNHVEMISFPDEKAEHPYSILYYDKRNIGGLKRTLFNEYYRQLPCNYNSNFIDTPDIDNRSTYHKYDNDKKVKTGVKNDLLGKIEVAYGNKTKSNDEVVNKEKIEKEVEKVEEIFNNLESGNTRKPRDKNFFGMYVRKDDTYVCTNLDTDRKCVVGGDLYEKIIVRLYEHIGVNCERARYDKSDFEIIDVDDYCYRRFIVHNLKTDEYIRIPIIEKTIEEIGKGRCVHVQFENLTYNSKRANTSYACEINTTAHGADKRTWFCSRTVSEGGFVKYRYLNKLIV